MTGSNFTVSEIATLQVVPDYWQDEEGDILEVYAQADDVWAARNADQELTALTTRGSMLAFLEGFYYGQTVKSISYKEAVEAGLQGYEARHNEMQNYYDQ